MRYALGEGIPSIYTVKELTDGPLDLPARHGTGSALHPIGLSTMLAKR